MILGDQYRVAHIQPTNILQNFQGTRIAYKIASVRGVPYFSPSKVVKYPLTKYLAGLPCFRVL